MSEWFYVQCFESHTSSLDNKELVLKETKSCFGLVNDAIAESEEVPYTTIGFNSANLCIL